MAVNMQQKIKNILFFIFIAPNTMLSPVSIQLLKLSNLVFKMKFKFSA